MSVVPSIKGSVFINLVEDVHKLLASSKLKREELSRWLKPADLEILDAPVLAHEWYDVRVYARMADLLRDVEGGGKNEYHVKRGARSARRLLDGGLYGQLEYMQTASFGRKSDPNERHAAFGRDLARTTTLSSAILNFGRWEVKPDPSHPRRWIMEIMGARDYPDALAWASAGFSNELARVHKRKDDFWVWERPDRDRIVFRMARDP